MAVRDAVLSQSQEFKEARLRAFENATAVYDLLTVVVVRWGQVDLLHEVKDDSRHERPRYNGIFAVVREGDEIFSWRGPCLDSVRPLPHQYGAVHARVHGPPGRGETRAAEGDALSFDREAVLRAFEHGRMRLFPMGARYNLKNLV